MSDLEEVHRLENLGTSRRGEEIVELGDGVLDGSNESKSLVVVVLGEAKCEERVLVDRSRIGIARRTLGLRLLLDRDLLNLLGPGRSLCQLVLVHLGVVSLFLLLFLFFFLLLVGLESLGERRDFSGL